MEKKYVMSLEVYRSKYWLLGNIILIAVFYCLVSGCWELGGGPPDLVCVIKVQYMALPCLMLAAVVNVLWLIRSFWVREKINPMLFSCLFSIVFVSWIGELVYCYLKINQSL